MKEENIKVVYDATWLAKYFKLNVMHGGLRVTLELISGMKKENDVDVFFAINKWDPTLLNSLRSLVTEKYGYKTTKIINNNNFNLNVLNVDNKILSRINKFLNYKLNNNKIFNSKSLTNMNIYHSPLEAIPKEIKLLKHVKMIFTSHDLMPFVRPDISPPLFHDILKPAYDSIDETTTVIAVSNSTKIDLLNYRTDLREEQVKVVHIAADEKVFYPNEGVAQLNYIKIKYNLQFEGYLLCLNRIQKYKNTQLIIDVYIDLVNEGYLKDIGLLLIGEFESIKIKCEYLRKYSNYKIKFIDFVPDEELSIFYSNSICFIYMSLFEGFGLPILEAMQCGTPVICSSAKSLPEIAGDACIIQDPYDKVLLANNILKIYANDSLRHYLIYKGLKQSQQFSWKKHIREVKEIYYNILSD